MGPSRPVSPSPSLDHALSTLQQVWGYQDFRPHQRRAVLAALRGRDCLTVLPTGGGKSLCYQVPALVLPGLTVVVSPLISLMQDQVAALRARGVAAAYVSSTQKPELQRAVWEAVRDGVVRLLYVAPERLSQVASLAQHRPIALLAVDEAHCISEWGHDFRPHYRALGRCRALLGNPPTLAVTATATPATRVDIARVLGLRRPVTVLASFDRPNLSFLVREVADERTRLRAVAARLRGLDGTAVVYAPTRNRADGAARILRMWGFSAAPYHAGLPGPARRALLARYMDGGIRIMVATSAFGMGIDKADVRLVIHIGIPTRPEAYYQEAGRAGRDGKPARCELLWTKADLSLAAVFAKTATTAKPAAHPETDSHRKACRAALKTMARYVRARSCRRKILLGYLGERVIRCAGCDRCSLPAAAGAQ